MKSNSNFDVPQPQNLLSNLVSGLTIRNTSLLEPYKSNRSGTHRDLA